MPFSSGEILYYVHPFAGDDLETDVMLFFTDNKNEPRSINIRRCIETDEEFTGNPFNFEGQNLEDFINACPRVPNKAIQFEFENVTDENTVVLESNFKDSDGLIFAYQNVYKNGYVSSLSNYSKVAYPPGIASLGNRSIEEVIISNKITLSIPKQGDEVKSIRILYKEGDGGVWKVIDQVSASIDLGNVNYNFLDDEELAGVYSFYKDRIYPIVPLDESSKNFDKLPPIAQSQAVSGNRLMYGNYFEGFDPINTYARSTVLYKERLTDLQIFDIDASSAMYRGQLAGFTVDTSGLPETIPAGLYEINIRFKPTRNIHVYNTRHTYIGSRHRTVDGVTTFDDEFTGEVTEAQAGETGANSGITSDERLSLSHGTGQSQNYDNGVSLRLYNSFDNNQGGVARVYWDQAFDDGTHVQVGASPAAPLILGIKEIPISFVIDVNESATNSDISSVIDTIIASSNGLYGQGVNLEETDVPNVLLSQFNIELVYSDGGDNVIQPKIELDLGLNNEQQFEQTSSLAELICIIPGKPVGQEAGGCGGFFIVNKADVTFGIHRITTSNPTNSIGDFESYSWSEAVTQTGTKKGYFFQVEEIDATYENSFFSCFPKPAMGKGEVGSDGEVVTFKPNTPWRLFDDGGDSKNIFWPIARGSKLKNFNGNRYYVQESYEPGTVYAMPDGMSLTGEDADGNEEIVEDAVPYRIGSWLALSSVGVQEGSPAFNNWYSESIDFGSAQQNITFSWASESQVEDFASIRTYGAVMTDTGFASMLGRRHFIDTSGPTFYTQSSLCHRWRGYIDSFEYKVGQSGGNANPIHFAVVDGDCGPGGQMSQDSAFSNSSIDINGDNENITTKIFNLGDVLTETAITAVAYTGSAIVSDQAVTHPGNNASPDLPPMEVPSGEAPLHNRYGSVWNTTLLGLVTNMPYIDLTANYLNVTATENIGSISPVKDKAFDAASFNNIKLTSNFSSLADTELSFKTRASHDFGIAYYDKRGRRSNINKLETTYVPGYSDEERPDGTKGAVSIQLDIKHAAPAWADKYKIFYSNRNEAKRFIQYVAGDAFLEKNSSSEKGKIYVSLNYLQGHKIAYSNSYGARDKDTDEPTLYRYSKGDVLRLISHYKTDEERIFLGPDYEFNVLGVETLNSLLDDHPLYSDGTFVDDPELNKLKRNGQFLVLQDNPKALGFTRSEIASGSDDWDKRCVFEIVSPLKESTEETQPYFETIYGGDVIYSGSLSEQVGEPTYFHEQPEGGHIIEEGDVFFRQVPLNVRAYADGSFVDLITVDEEGKDNSEARLLPYYLETESLTDLHRSAAKGYGKPNLINNDAFKKRMQSSVIFSQKTESHQFKLKHTSFPDIEQISFDLPEKHGNLNYIAGEDEYITSLQENKAAVIPVDRAITTTAQGVNTLNITDRVLNSARFYFGEGGPAGNPESVVAEDGYIYFADKHNKRISRLDPGGQTIENISDQGMEEYFRRQFDRLLDSSAVINRSDVRIVGGFDPMENEFIVSFLRPQDINAPVEEGIFTVAPLTSSLAALELNDEEPFVNTIAFDHTGGKAWKSRYSFNSTNYSNVNNHLISFKNNQVWDHGKNEKRNRFHNQDYMSMVKPVSVAQGQMGASATKLYNSLSLEGYYDWPAIIKTHNETATIPTFTNYEGNKYAAIPKSRNSSSTSNVKTVGVVESFSYLGAPFDNEATLVPSIDLKFVSPISTSLAMGVGTSATMMVDGNVNDNPPIVTPIDRIDDYTIRYSLIGGIPAFATPVPVGATIIHTANSSVYGDNLRDKYATVMLLNNSAEEAELYSINLEVSPSKLDPSS